MDPDEELSSVFDRGFNEGVETLSKEDRELYFIQSFILEYEMEGLYGLLYNWIPEWSKFDDAIAAMRMRGMNRGIA